MMKKYEKPTALVNNDLAEGVYMASGVAGSDCYTADVIRESEPAVGKAYYTFRVKSAHSGDHITDQEVVIISFNTPVKYHNSEGSLLEGDNTTTLRIGYGRHFNQSESNQFGIVEVQPLQEGQPVSVVSCVVLCGGAGDIH